jgi:chromosome segregation ATPase
MPRAFARIGLLVLAAAVTAAMALPGTALADDDATLRQELTGLKDKIEEIDASLGKTGQSNAQLVDATKAYGQKLGEIKTEGEKLKDRARQLTAGKERLDAEHDAATQICRKKTATDAEYKEAVAQCEKAGDAYQQHADAFRAEEQTLTAELAAYDAANAQLKAQYAEIERKREDLVTRQKSLEADRQSTVDRFNEIRDRLIALQSKPK